MDDKFTDDATKLTNTGYIALIKENRYLNKGEDEKGVYGIEDKLLWVFADTVMRIKYYHNLIRTREVIDNNSVTLLSMWATTNDPAITEDILYCLKVCSRLIDQA